MATRKLSPFGQAFKEARERGDTTFKFNGKEYTTELASGPSKAAAKPAAAASSKMAPPPIEAEVESAPARRTTSMPSGSLMGRIARSQGAESTFPEPQANAPVGERAARQREETGEMMSNMMRKLKRVMGTQSMRDEEAATENYAKGGKVRGWGKARGARKAKMY